MTTLIIFGLLIVFGIFLTTAFIGGFFLGHYKREDKLPDSLPSIKEVINAVRMDDKPREITRAEQIELDKANSFYN